MNRVFFQRIRISIIFLISSIGFIFYNFLVELHPETTIAILQTLFLWTLISLIPSILPLISNLTIIKRITIILGITIKLIESFIGVLYLLDSTNENYKIFGITMILFFSGLGLIGIIYSFKWLKMQEE
ncbi:MAG: hypothetical protein GQ564_17725 [Bacteroidales bacterium]|nr:hypothetical protein [Bacteroidales bacterium]